MDPITVSASAKINLFLRVLGREADGFHAIETLFCRIGLADELIAERRDAPGVVLAVDGADTGPDAENLAVRAAQLVLEATGHRFGVALTLRKRIPVRAGLGGGSSDAAAALDAVNRLAGNAVPRHELLQFASRLGSDVPFFVSGAPLAIGWGRGERLMTLPALPAAPGLLVVPARGVSTADAYRWVDQVREGAGRRGAVALDPESLRTWGDVARMAGNDFEAAVFPRLPEVRAAFELLVTTHPLTVRMSGSGSALFAIYRTPGDREDARMRLGRKHGAVLPFKTG